MEHECEFILRISEGKIKEDIINDELLGKGIIRGLEIIGEATKKLPLEVKENYPQVDWHAMAGMRDILIHNYFGIDYDVTWSTITNDIPELHHEIQRIIRLEKMK
ncbi:MAG TPA: HepT-like ribonuclease domain-containing protein [Saprospiraceae bacterium]|nr:HepT-like ribonuclease domain-containing protein [Saprospiraceae bacterium]